MKHHQVWQKNGDYAICCDGGWCSLWIINHSTRHGVHWLYVMHFTQIEIKTNPIIPMHPANFGFVLINKCEIQFYFILDILQTLYMLFGT